MTTYGSTGGDSLMKQARKAHTVLDVDASRAVHLAKVGHASEAHLDNGGHIKSAVFGGLDGIITTFATVTSVAGSGLPHAVILILGLAHLVADGLSMGMGDYLSTQAETDLINHERSRELWEMENFPEGEKAEMIELYEAKGISSEDAKIVVDTLSKYKEAFVDIMMVEELKLMPVDDDENPFIGGLITFGSFVLFGAVPLLSYLINLLPGVSLTGDQALWGSCFLTVLTLFMLGAVKGQYVGQKWYLSGMYMAINGTVAAGMGWVIGYLLALTGVQDVVLG
ncbi:hypothetical protein SPRG_08953 [Saprolegnia parasitica CBS 223.65]|uniref:Uncharacterized protein n=1 Tax=Saprolegnia parasitica (strain CBS 223.65) TaxID=695850 RepID=A0A067C4G1_SAPPC|nr:hypothetical protein SPRG_08953 [Saprolegnia parasitica CBS 223.65]KDO25654.1 hypothetical protein SPRG_08953 [Saprolegnia parasitica CBS 223.65]|eukprot:XP_012203685.1 hypothetical protein SPRG_08953 [Saprolegnia parasitica CBS 223.65]